MRTRAVGAIVRLNVLQALRHRFFFGVLVFLVGYLAVCGLLGILSVGHMDKILRDTGLAGIEWIGAVVSVFGLTLLFAQQRESRIMDVYLNHVSRLELIVGQWIAQAVVITVFLMLAGTGLSAVLVWFKAFHPAVLAALYPMALKLLLLSLWVFVLLSVFDSPLAALLCGLGVYAASEFMPVAYKILITHGNAWQQALGMGLRYVLIQADVLDCKAQAAWGLYPGWKYAASAGGYAVGYGCVLALINWAVFKRREF